jgi:hypothetical protein
VAHTGSLAEWFLLGMWRESYERGAKRDVRHSSGMSGSRIGTSSRYRFLITEGRAQIGPKRPRTRNKRRATAAGDSPGAMSEAEVAFGVSHFGRSVGYV